MFPSWSIDVWILSGYFGKNPNFLEWMRAISPKVGNELTISDFWLTENDIKDLTSNFNGVQITVWYFINIKSKFCLFYFYKNSTKP